MKILLKSAQIIDKSSNFHKQTKDILIDNGIISKISDSITEKVDKIISLKNLHLSTGWVDTSVSFGEPGFEERENLQNGLKTAAISGFTTILLNPNTSPVIDNKSAVEFINNQTKNQITSVHVIGSLTKFSKGKELAEIFDMQNSGAIAFGDYKHAVENPNLLKIALLYAQNQHALIMSFPQENNLAKGYVNEGVNSTKIGLKGKPNLSENQQIARDLFLLEYTGGKLHIPTISTKESVSLIAEAKKKGLQVSCSVSINNLFFTDDEILDFNTNAKLNPPLRTEKDKAALTEGVKKGIIDTITSNHNPIDIEHKKVPFEQAQYGSVGLESFFGLANQVLDIETLIEGITSKPRKVFGLDKYSISVGEKANFTLFNPDYSYTFSKKDIVSTSKNSLALHKKLNGIVYGVLVGENYTLSPHSL